MSLYPGVRLGMLTIPRFAIGQKGPALESQGMNAAKIDLGPGKSRCKSRRQG